MLADVACGLSAGGDHCPGGGGGDQGDFSHICEAADHDDLVAHADLVVHDDLVVYDDLAVCDDLAVHDNYDNGYCENFGPQVEKVVCETEFRPTCTVKLEKDCRNVTRSLVALFTMDTHLVLTSSTYFPPSADVDLSLAQAGV